MQELVFHRMQMAPEKSKAWQMESMTDEQIDRHTDNGQSGTFVVLCLSGVTKSKLTL